MKKNWLCIAALLILAGILPGCLQNEPQPHETDFGTTALVETTASVTTAPADEQPKPEPDPRYLVLVNKTHPIPDEYNPEKDSYILEPLKTLTEWVKPDGREQKLEWRALRALDAMFRAMQEDGITDVFVTSSYRTFAYQDQLFNSNYNSERGASVYSKEARDCLGEEYIQANYISQKNHYLNDEDAEKLANFYSAKAGQSEHHTGLCVDLMTNGMKELDESFADTAAFAWLQENACRFGFILRYPKGKETVTGYCYEPWHYRFVGLEAAAEIWEQSITLEEYLEQN